MSRHVAQGIDTITIGIIDIQFLRLGASIIVKSTLPKVLRGSLFARGLVGLLETTFVGNLALLTMVAGPFTVALDQRLEILDENVFKRQCRRYGDDQMGRGR